MLLHVSATNLNHPQGPTIGEEIYSFENGKIFVPIVINICICIYYHFQLSYNRLYMSSNILAP